MKIAPRLSAGGVAALIGGPALSITLFLLPAPGGMSGPAWHLVAAAAWMIVMIPPWPSTWFSSITVFTIMAMYWPSSTRTTMALRLAIMPPTCGSWTTRCTSTAETGFRSTPKKSYLMDTLHHVYVGRNTAHDNKQTGLWTKQATDVAFTYARGTGPVHLVDNIFTGSLGTHITADSPALDNGSTSDVEAVFETLYGLSIAVGMDGTPRPQGDGEDMGCFEQ